MINYICFSIIVVFLVIAWFVFLLCISREKDPWEDDEQEEYLKKWYEKHSG